MEIEIGKNLADAISNTGFAVVLGIFFYFVGKRLNRL